MLKCREQIVRQWIVEVLGDFKQSLVQAKNALWLAVDGNQLGHRFPRSSDDDFFTCANPP